MNDFLDLKRIFFVFTFVINECEYFTIRMLDLKKKNRFSIPYSTNLFICSSFEIKLEKRQFSSNILLALFLHVQIRSVRLKIQFILILKVGCSLGSLKLRIQPKAFLRYF